MTSKARTIFPNQKPHYLICSSLFLLALLSLIYFTYHIINIKKDTATCVYGIDLIAYYTAAKLVEAGEISEIYAEVKEDFSVVNSGKFFETAKRSGFQATPTRYVYLPIFLVPFQLLTRINFSTVATLWLILNLVMVISIILIQWLITKDLPYPALRLMLIISLNLFSFPLFYALKLGQTTIIIYLAICLIYCFTLKGQDNIAGIFLGLIIALKFSPLLFALYFLYRKRYGLVISCFITVAIIILLSIIIYGLPIHKIYWHYLTSLSGFGIAGWSNQSLAAILLRLSAEGNILQFNPIKANTLISIVRYTLTFSLIGIMYLSFKKKRGLSHQLLYPLEFSAVILCLLIIPSISWIHYFMFANFSIILFLISYLKIYPHQAWITIPSLVISYAMISFNPDYHSLAATLGQGVLMRFIISLPFLGACFLLLITLSFKNGVRQW